MKMISVVFLMSLSFNALSMEQMLEPVDKIEAGECEQSWRTAKNEFDDGKRKFYTGVERSEASVAATTLGEQCKYTREAFNLFEGAADSFWLAADAFGDCVFWCRGSNQSIARENIGVSRNNESIARKNMRVEKEWYAAHCQ